MEEEGAHHHPALGMVWYLGLHNVSVSDFHPKHGDVFRTINQGKRDGLSFGKQRPNWWIVQPEQSGWTS